MAVGPHKKLPPDLVKERPGVEKGTPEWQAWCNEMSDYLGFVVCGRQNRKGTPCPQPRVKDRTACHYHGGKSPIRVGPSNPAWKHGRASMFAEVLPERLQDAYNALMEDPKLLALESDIALADLRIIELVRGWRDGTDPVQACVDALEHIATLRTAIAEDDIVAAGEAADNIADTITQGASAQKLWDDIGKEQEKKRRLVDTEGKRLERMQAFITADEARAFTQMLIAIVTSAANDEIEDVQLRRRYLGRVYQEVMQISGMGNRQQRRPHPEQLPAWMVAKGDGEVGGP